MHEQSFPIFRCSRARSRLVALPVALLVALLWTVALAVPSARADQDSAALPSLFEQLLEAGSASEATRLESRIWQEWLEAPDEASRILLSRVSLAMQSGELDLALELADELIDVRPDFAEGWNKRATIHYLREDDDSSVADIRETLVREPRHFGAISGLGLIFLRQGDAEAALGAFEQVLAISPASVSAQRSVERVRAGLGREI